MTNCISLAKNYTIYSIIIYNKNRMYIGIFGGNTWGVSPNTTPSDSFGSQSVEYEETY